MKKKFLKIGFFSIFLATLTVSSQFILSSCSSIGSVSLYQIDEINTNGSIKWGSNPLNINSNENKVDNVSTIDSSFESIISGKSSYRKYLFFYGTIVDNDDTRPFRTWLTATSSNPGVILDNIEMRNDFFKYWYNYKYDLKDVKIIFYLDVFDSIEKDNEKTVDGFINIFRSKQLPFTKWTEENLLDYANEIEKIKSNFTITKTYNSFEDLPNEYKSLFDTYIRDDRSAVYYRSLVNYSNSLRTNVSPIVPDASSNELSGMIAFSDSKNPISTTLSAKYGPNTSPITEKDNFYKLFNYFTDKNLDSKKK